MVSFLQGQACLAGRILRLIMMSGDIWQGKINAICSTAFALEPLINIKDLA